MKNLATLFFTLLILFSTGSTILFAQDTGYDPRVWSIVTMNPSAPQWVKEPSNWVPAEPITRYFGIADATVGPNYRVKPGNTAQSELSIDVHPTNSNIVFGSSNASNWPPSIFYGTGVYWTLDGGATQPWLGTDDPGTLSGFGRNSGDPVSVIGSDGRFYENYINNAYGQSVAVSTNNGANWTTYVVAPNPGSLADKNHYMVDKTATSPYVNRSYCSWTDFGGSYDSEVVLRYSTDFGATWSTKVNLSGTLTTGSHAQGTNIQTGPNGEVYVAYAIYDANWTDGEDGIGFSKSTDGGTTWTHLRAYNQVNFGIRGNLSSKNGIRVASFPSMAVDRSGGPNNGNIYITWPQRAGVTPAGNSPDIVLIKSTDGGATWSAPVRVNDDPLTNSKDQYYPWCTVDQATGQLELIFYDSRDVPNNQAEVFMATSIDGGNTFNNFKVSDQPHTPMPIGGIYAGGYAGDYIGIAALDDIAYPFWMDNRLGTDHYQAWTASVTFGPPCPIDPPSNPSPANGATNIPITGNTATWTNGAGATQIEVWFDGSIVYSGTPITSFSLAPYEPLSYSTTYGWQIKGKNDSCTVAGPAWTFTTVQDPNLVIDTVDVYPQNSNYWTGTCNASSKTQVSLVNAGGANVGWMAFDISSIPNNATINSIEFHGYLYNNAWPYWSITPMGSVNPVTGGASAIYSQVSNNYLEGTAYSYNVESGTLANTWLTRALETTAPADMQSALAQDWFAIGIVEWEFSASYYVYFQGWAEANKPYLKVYYQYSVPVELTSFTANQNNDIVELSWITATETNNQGFEVQRSNGGEFETIAFVEGHGTTTEVQAYSYSDKNVTEGSYNYRLKQIDFDGTFEYSNVVEVDISSPAVYALEQNYPNPFNPSTTIKYSIAEDGYVKLSVYNMLGEEVTTIVNNLQKAGRYEVNFNASGLSSGVYVYRIEAGNYTASKKLMLMK
jgi:hypothetical protein